MLHGVKGLYNQRTKSSGNSYLPETDVGRIVEEQIKVKKKNHWMRKRDFPGFALSSMW
jgi:hypothetical protein